MMKEVNGGFSQVRGLPGALESTRGSVPGKAVNDSLFRDQLEALKNSLPTPNAKSSGVASIQTPTTLKFSNHAVDRMQARGIRFSPEQMTKLEGAIGKAEAKGAKNTLLLTDEAALIVSVKDKTVVTVMDKANLKENVFTNIDSTVMI